jgi:hypothetical protein
VNSTNELFSKYFTEALVKEVSDFYIDTKSKKSRENMLILERQTDSIRRELNGAITGVAVANDNTFNLNPALNVRRASARKSRCAGKYCYLDRIGKAIGIGQSNFA